MSPRCQRAKQPATAIPPTRPPAADNRPGREPRGLTGPYTIGGMGTSVGDYGNGRMFSGQVRAHRRRLGMSQEELAARTGVSVRGIRNLEAGRTGRPRPGTVRLLADAFELAGAERDRFCRSALEVAGPDVARGRPV